MGNDNGDRIVARFRNGKLVKGFMKSFSEESDMVVLNDQHTLQDILIEIAELKAIFFVKDFVGSSHYKERKVFGIRKNFGKKVFIKFRDDESLVGFIEGEVPWDKGFSLAKLGKKVKGFFLTPADGDGNNNKVFVVGEAIQDITIIV
jgi:hypothetical protein